jgi:hypothetical protein
VLPGINFRSRTELEAERRLDDKEGRCNVRYVTVGQFISALMGA